MGSQTSEDTEIEFIEEKFSIKRFRSFEDYGITTALILEQSHLTETPIQIHESLRYYLKFKRLIPYVELALANHESKLIVGDTLYSLHGNSYSKQKIDSSGYQSFELVEHDPIEAMTAHLTLFMQTKGTSRVTEAWARHKSLNLSGIDESCGGPNDFDFVSDPSRNTQHTDMCVMDFNYPRIKINPNDIGFTPNAPGAVVMWNTS